MTEKAPNAKDRMRNMALARWDNEGGAGPNGSQEGKVPSEVPQDLPQLTETELVLLRVRVIALENLVISLLADASDRRLQHAREMAAYISPRPGVTHHVLTMNAAATYGGPC